VPRDNKGRLADDAPAPPGACAPPLHAVAPYTSYLLCLAMRQADAHIADALAPYDLRLPHLCVLRLLATGPHAQTTLGHTLHLNRMMIMRLVTAMEDAGLVHRTPTPHNRHAYVVTLTPAGQALLLQAEAVVGRAEEAFFAPLAPDEYLQFRALLARLLEAHACVEPPRAERADRAPVPDGC